MKRLILLFGAVVAFTQLPTLVLAGQPIFGKNLPAILVTLAPVNIATFAYKAPDDARDVAGLLGDQLMLVKVKATGFPAADTRYLYQVGSAGTNVYPGGDTNFQFYTDIGAGNYIDIETGIGYDATTGAAIAVAKPDEMVTLRNTIIHASPQLVDADGNATTQDKCTDGCKKLLAYVGNES